METEGLDAKSVGMVRGLVDILLSGADFSSITVKSIAESVESLLGISRMSSKPIIKSTVESWLEVVSSCDTCGARQGPSVLNLISLYPARVLLPWLICQLLC